MNITNSTSVHIDGTGIFEGDRLSPAHIIAVCFMCAINLIAFFGNLVVLVIILKSTQLRRNLTYIFVTNLCISDILASAAVMPFSIMSFVTGIWSFPFGVCVLNGFTNSLVVFTSILSICAISVERFYSIKFPMHYSSHMTLSRALLIVGYTWFHSSTFALLPVFGWNSYSFQPYKGHCSFSWNTKSHHQWYIITVAVTCFVIPGTIITCMYVAIYLVAKRAATQVSPIVVHARETVSEETESTHCDYPQSPARSSGDTTAGNNITAVWYTNHVPFAPNPGQQPQQYRWDQGQWKAVRTVLLITGMFILLWGPSFVVNVVGILCTSVHRRHVTESVTTWLGYLSFAINPCIYGWLNRTIREEALKTIHQFRPCSKSSSPESDVSNGPPDQNNVENFLEFLERTDTTRSSSLQVNKNAAPINNLQLPVVKEDGS